MSYALQCCVRCSTLEDGHTGLGDRYICVRCHHDGHRVDAGGNIYQVFEYKVHVWDPGRSVWRLGAFPKIAARSPRDAYLIAKEGNPGQIVHVARVLTEPCSPGERAHA